MNLPNLLTMLRIVLIPVFAALYTHGHVIWALIIYILAAFTDALDGYLARRFHQITSFGMLMDPLADKLMQLTMLFCLAATGHVPYWLLYCLLVREVYQVSGSTYLLSRKKVVVSAKMPGKIATCLLIGGILLVYPWHQSLLTRQIGQIMLIGGLGFAIGSSVCYTISAVKQVKQSAC